MSEPPTQCAYCDGTDPDCGFCELGKPLDTPEDWARTWGRITTLSFDNVLADLGLTHADLDAEAEP